MNTDRHRPKVCVITHSPSPYMVELFDAVVDEGLLDLHVIYLHTSAPERLWEQRVPRHEYSFADKDEVASLVILARAAALLVVHYYRHPLSARLMKEAEKGGQRWVFWGERPRCHGLSWLSTLSRRWFLRHLHGNDAPIWGMGRMAVEAYRAEFGDRHSYVNLPYYSDLRRFVVDRSARPNRERTVLFSGSLISRKGVDLIADAFAKLVRQGVGGKLRILGSGELEAALRSRLAACSERVDFIGFKDWPELPAVYATADVLCVPSRYDGWALVVPEGLAAGLPVISTTQTGAAVEFVESGMNGWLISPNDGEAVYRALHEALTVTDEHLAQMSASAVATVRNHQVENGAHAFIAAVMQAMKSS